MGCPLWPLRAPFKRPLNSSKTEIFKNNNFFCFTLSHLAYLPKIMFLSPKLRLLAITKSVNLAPWAPFPLFKRAPDLIKNENFQKQQFLLFYFVTLSLITKNY